ncbi:sugar ABC transporter permease, partial [Pseudoalteromonas sp. 2103]|nr:sugar ABC transporter permease [Pseudoalteromonas sp. 2103]
MGNQDNLAQQFDMERYEGKGSKNVKSPKNNQKPAKINSEKNLPYLLFLPTLTLLAIVTIFPIIYSLVVSFSGYDTFGNSIGFTGIDNYSNVLTNGDFWN